jgi:hypothetical protein
MDCTDDVQELPTEPGLNRFASLLNYPADLRTETLFTRRCQLLGKSAQYLSDNRSFRPRRTELDFKRFDIEDHLFELPIVIFI